MMNVKALSAGVVLALFACGVAAPSAVADKPEWAGKGKGKGEWHEKGKGKGHGHAKGHGARRDHFFADHHRGVVHEYYAESFRSGRCPPGLAKKNNGCMPPGQAKKKWRIGRPLPHDVVYYPVPQDLVVRLGPPPAGQDYVRVAGDILLISAASHVVLDALQVTGR